MNEYAEICHATAHLSNGLVIEEILRVNIKSLNVDVCAHIVVEIVRLKRIRRRNQVLSLRISLLH